MSRIDRNAWLEAVQTEDSFTRRRAVLELRRDHYDTVSRLFKKFDWKPLHWTPAYAGEIQGHELKYGPRLDLPDIIPRVGDERLDLRLRQMSISAMIAAVLDDPINQPDAPFFDSATIVAQLLISYMCMPEPALRATAATIVDQMAGSCRPWFDPGRPPLAGIAGVRDWLGYVERTYVWEILDELAVVALPMLLDDYDAVRTVGGRLLTHFPSLLNYSLSLVARVLRNEKSSYARDELGLSFAVLLQQSGQPLDLSHIDLSPEAQITIEALRQYPNFSAQMEQDLDMMRRTLGCSRQIIGHGWRAHVLLTEANARKAGFTEYVSHSPHFP